MKIALAQISSGGDVDANLSVVTTQTVLAAERGADAVIFPEASMIAFGNDLAAASERHSTRWQEAMRDLASREQVTVFVGEFEPVDGIKVRNVLAVYAPGAARQTYAKLHLFDAFGTRESDSVAPGDKPLVVQLGDAYAGLAICYDIRFPKLFAELSRAGAQIMIVSASWGAGEGKADQWRLLARARAIDSNAFVIAVDQADPEVSGVAAIPGAPTGVGGSIVVDPFGKVIAEVQRAEALELVELDLSVATKAKQVLPVLENARLGY